MLTIKVHSDCVADLEKITLLDSLMATRFFAVLEQLKRDPDLLKILMKHQAQDGIYDVKKWVRLQNQGDPIWRLLAASARQLYALGNMYTTAHHQASNCYQCKPMYTRTATM